MNLEPATSSDIKSASAIISTGPAIFYGLQVNAGSGNASIQVYSSQSASGVTLDYHNSINSNTNQSQWYSNGILAPNGIYVTLTGSGAQYIIYYSRIG